MFYIVNRKGYPYIRGLKGTKLREIKIPLLNNDNIFLSVINLIGKVGEILKERTLKPSYQAAASSRNQLENILENCSLSEVFQRAIPIASRILDCLKKDKKEESIRYFINILEIANEYKNSKPE